MTYPKAASCCFSAILGLAIGIGGLATARAQTQTVYNSIPKPLPGNVASEGPEAYAFSQLGDGFSLAGETGGTLGQVTVVMSSWACQNGSWVNNCVTASGATFSQSVTINIYGVGVGPVINGLLATMTQTFNIPYRPSSTPAQCGGDAQRWYDRKDKTCYHGFAVPISISFSGLHLPIPANNEVIVTVAYNTTDFGPIPIGQTACNQTSAGCPYDSLNISTDGSGSTGLVGGVGSVLDANGIFVNYTLPNTSCSGTAPPTVIGSVALD